ncbi:MAG: hypothetical protein JWM11_4060, partial [Planctomycetaceae bacterium]|nr:hypothetical protein [Planctomycetaceae bacterium]
MHSYWPRCAARTQACFVALLLVSPLFLSGVCWGQDKANQTQKIDGSLEVVKIAIPNATDQAESRKTIRELFKKEFDLAKTPKGKTALAQTLLSRTNELQNDPASLYVLLTEGAENAAAGGDITLALKAVAEIHEHFATPALELQEKIAKLATPLAKTSDQILPLIEMHQSLIRESLEADDVATAERVSLGAVTLSRKSDFPILKDQLLATSKEVAAFKAAFKTADEARQALKKQPDNRSANLIWGKYVCFMKGDWTTGLPLLIQSQDQILAPLAKRDLTPPAESEANVALGDEWWAIGDKEKDPLRSTIWQHAAESYYRALPGLSGLNLTTTERKLNRLFGGAKVYTSTDDPMGIPIADAALSLGPAGTVECWIQTLANESMLFSKRGLEDDGSLGVRLYEGRATFFENASFHYVEARTDVVLNDRIWHHIAIVKAGSKAALFIDGKLVTRLDVREDLP